MAIIRDKFEKVMAKAGECRPRHLRRRLIRAIKRAFKVKIAPTPTR
jgi:hypothetical protein